MLETSTDSTQGLQDPKVMIVNEVTRWKSLRSAKSDTKLTTEVLRHECFIDKFT
mgnify:CR=1 FL=1